MEKEGDNLIIENSKILINPYYWRILTDIAILSVDYNKKDISLSQLFNDLDKIRTDPMVYKVINPLVDLHIIVFTKTIGTLKFIKINTRKIELLARQGLDFHKSVALISKTTRFYETGE